MSRPRETPAASRRFKEALVRIAHATVDRICRSVRRRRGARPEAISLVFRTVAIGRLPVDGVHPWPSRGGRRCAGTVLPSVENYTTLSGGSLGSCVDEERSQLREVM